MSTFYAMPGDGVFASRLTRTGKHACHALQLHRFPDGETLVRIDPVPAASDAVIVCTLDHPDPKVVPLLMAAATLRELGARRIGLVAPYLAYMRQDTRFHPGEAVSARIFGKLLAGAFDWLVTVDPHLHRYRRMADAYPLDARVVHAAPRIAAWITRNVKAPLIVGPDGESAQWVSDVAHQLDAPFVVSTKNRYGDRDVRVNLPGVERWRGHTPVLVDDIISSGRTMVENLRALVPRMDHAPVCIGVHGIFAQDALDKLRSAGASRIVTCNTIPGPFAQIDVSEEVAAAVNGLCSTADAAVAAKPRDANA
jgi:ribose-phosphate pyrophosphokinase